MGKSFGKSLNKMRSGVQLQLGKSFGKSLNKMRSGVQLHPDTVQRLK